MAMTTPARMERHERAGATVMVSSIWTSVVVGDMACLAAPAGMAGYAPSTQRERSRSASFARAESVPGRDRDGGAPTVEGAACPILDF
jgi:hypothetical protein